MFAPTYFDSSASKGFLISNIKAFVNLRKHPNLVSTAASRHGQILQQFRAARRLLSNRGSGTKIEQGASATLQSCRTKGNVKSAISVLDRGEAFLARCTTAAEVPNVADGSGVLKYQAPALSEHPIFQMMKILAVLAVLVLTGAAGVFNALPRLVK
jgi:hypothetical protein